MSDSPDRGCPPQSADPTSGGRPALADSVRIATELWIVVILAQLVGYFAQYPMMRDTWDRQVRDLPANTPREQLDMLSSGWLLTTVLVVVAVVLTALSATVVFFTRRGYNWARLVLGALGVYVFVNLLFAVFGDVSPRWAMIPIVLGGVAAVGATVLLMRRDADTYCREMAEYRKTAKSGRSAYPAPAYPPQPYPGQPYPGQPYQGQQYEPHQYPTQQDPTQQYPTQQDQPPAPYPPVAQQWSQQQSSQQQSSQHETDERPFSLPTPESSEYGDQQRSRPDGRAADHDSHPGEDSAPTEGSSPRDHS